MSLSGAKTTMNPPVNGGSIIIGMLPVLIGVFCGWNDAAVKVHFLIGHYIGFK